MRYFSPEVQNALWVAEFESVREFKGIDVCREDQIRRLKMLEIGLAGIPHMIALTPKRAQDIAVTTQTVRLLADMCRACRKCDVVDRFDKPS